jgi:hypothetical protein
MILEAHGPLPLLRDRIVCATVARHLAKKLQLQAFRLRIQVLSVRVLMCEASLTSTKRNTKGGLRARRSRSAGLAGEQTGMRVGEGRRV